MSNLTPNEVLFTHVVLEGTPYEVGKQQAEMLKNDPNRDILSEPIPKGLCMHHYSNGLGTLWSMIFDVTDVTADIGFWERLPPGADHYPYDSA